MRYLLRFTSLFGKRAAERELDEELRFHLNRLIESNLARGMNAVEARAAAIHRFGGFEQVKEQCRDVTGLRFVEQVSRDIFYSLRMLAKHRVYAIAIVLTLGLGIGANTAVFNIVNNIFFRPLAFQADDGLLALDGSMIGPTGDRIALLFREATFARIENATRSFLRLAAVRSEDMTLTGREVPERVSAMWTSPGTCEILGIRPIIGRWFDTEEKSARSDGRSAVISHSLWQRYFGGSKNVSERTLILNREKYMVVGVLPPRINFPANTEVWLPTVIDPAKQRAFYVCARLQPGFTLAQAREQLGKISKDQRRQDPALGPTYELQLRSLRDRLIDKQAGVPLALLLVVGFVLLLAGANVANLMLLRAISRQKEFGIRRALGATNFDTARLIIIEGLLLSIVASGVGLACTLLFSRYLVPLMPLYLTGLGLDATAIDYRTAWFGFGMALAVGGMSCLLPVWRIWRSQGQTFLAVLPKSPAAGGNRRMLSFFVAGEIALSFVLLAASGMMFEQLRSLKKKDLGFSLENTLAVRVTLPTNRYSSADGRALFADQALERLGQVPGVMAAAISTADPLHQAGGNWSMSLLSEEMGSTTAPYVVDQRLVSRSFFQTLGTHLLEGRPFLEDARGVAEVVVDEDIATHFWPNQSALGKRVRINRADEPWLTVVGVARNTSDLKQHQPAAYLPYAHQAFRPAAEQITLLVHSSIEPAGIAQNVRTALAEIDSDLPASDISTLEHIRSNALLQNRINVTVVTSFAVFGVLLAALGMYAVTAFNVSERLFEMAIRIALGARSRDIMQNLLKGGGVLVFSGLLIGLGGAFLLSFGLSSLLSEASLDAATCAAAILCSGAIAFFASFLSAIRAVRVNPVMALKSE